MAGSQIQNKLSQKLGQRLALTPQLTQSLKVLAMNSMELEGYLEECLETNPLLEKETEQTANPPSENNTNDADVQDWRESGDDRWEAMYTPSSRDAFTDREAQWEDEQTLSDSLHEQVDRQPMEEVDRAIAHFLIDSLEDDGYFRADMNEIAANIQFDAEHIMKVLEEVVQELEPSGIGARDLTECLLLQLTDDDEATRLVRRLLLHHADALLEPDHVVAHTMECSLDDIEAARTRMRRLDPYPGHGLRGHTNIYIQPELIFRLNSQKEIEVEVPSYSWRGLRIQNQWKNYKFKGAEREFMDHASQEAKWLLHALDQRSETLMKVGQCLAVRQRAFLEHGILGLKPLTLQDVAEEVGLHESTISRVTNGKYAETPLGLIEMRRFFSAGLPTRGGGVISVYRVQQRVKTLIESEPAGKPISDQAIADRLQAEGIEIARRTVAKYREQLGLPPSSQRRREGKARRQQPRR